MQRAPLLLSVLILCITLATASLATAGGSAYTTYNMWYEVPTQMWAINYKRGTLLPAGTLVKNITINKEKIHLFQSISFKRVSDNKHFRVHLRRKFHPGKTIENYRQSMFTRQRLKEQTADMTEREINAILRGVLVTGMSKKAVKVAYGIPPQHKTPNLQGNIWRYWTSRLVSKNICFDKNGRTVRCVTNETL
ncbi:MAG: hypothetical protein U9R29_06585 [Thermodesulfobacteriota bacterium]|nr:hypothetical protein [Thermodesulfobacteriota bacterium]